MQISERERLKSRKLERNKPTENRIFYVRGRKMPQVGTSQLGRMLLRCDRSEKVVSSTGCRRVAKAAGKISAKREKGTRTGTRLQEEAPIAISSGSGLRAPISGSCRLKLINIYMEKRSLTAREIANLTRCMGLATSYPSTSRKVHWSR